MSSELMKRLDEMMVELNKAGAILAEIKKKTAEIQEKVDFWLVIYEANEAETERDGGKNE